MRLWVVLILAQQAGGDDALACEPGRYRHRPVSSAAVPAQAACAFCPAGKHQSASAAAGCDACPAGRYQYLNGQRHCAQCPGGRVANGERTLCACPGAAAAGAEGDDDDDGAARLRRRRLLLLLPCAPTHASAAAPTQGGAGSATPPADTPVPLLLLLHRSGRPRTRRPSRRNACPGGKYALPTPPQVASLLGSAVMQALLVCGVCPAGKQAVATQAAATPAAAPCASCARNRYAPRGGAAQCIACGRGRYQPAAGSRRCVLLPALDSGACPPGKHEASQPLLAAAGVTAAAAAAAVTVRSCRACAPGRFAAVWHRGSGGGAGRAAPQLRAGCSACAAGQYQPSKGQHRCTLCERGTAQPAAGGSRCFACPRMSYQRERGATLCMVCPDGKMQERPGQAYCGNETPQQLPPPLPPPVRTAVATTTPAPTPVPTRAPTFVFTYAPTPAPCAAGRYRRSLSQVAGQGCAPCRAGRFAHARGQQARCYRCPAGRYALAGASECAPQHTSHTAALLRVDLARSQLPAQRSALLAAATTLADASCPAGRFGTAASRAACAAGQVGNLSFASAVLATTTPLSGWQLVVAPAARVLARRCCASCPRGRFRAAAAAEAGAGEAALVSVAAPVANGTARGAGVRLQRRTLHGTVALLMDAHNGGAALVALLARSLGLPAARRNDTAGVAGRLAMALDVREIVGHGGGAAQQRPALLLQDPRGGAAGGWRAWLPGVACAACAAGRVSWASTAGSGAERCAPCAAGQFANAGACRRCPVGKFNGVRGNPLGCAACPAGKWGASYNPFACYDCRAPGAAAASGRACRGGARRQTAPRAAASGDAAAEAEAKALARQLRWAAVRREAAEQRGRGGADHRGRGGTAAVSSSRHGHHSGYYTYEQPAH